MFYVKTQDRATKKTVIASIERDNTFTYCPICDAEVPVDLADFVGDKSFDIYDTGFFCDECMEKFRKKGFSTHRPRLEHTLDGLMLTVDVLSKCGHGEAVDTAFNAFQIESLNDLDKNQYEPFCDALDRIAFMGRYVEPGDPEFEKAYFGDEDEEDEFAFVPEEMRNGMTNAELDKALRDMRLSPEMGKAVRGVFRKGFVSAPHLKREKGASI